jgi:hypothetical protein
MRTAERERELECSGDEQHSGARYDQPPDHDAESR